MVPFTNDYTDMSTREGYQFEFHCVRCGNGYASTFQHSMTGFDGRLLRTGGDLLGGDVGQTAAEVGSDAEWMRDGLRGSTRDKALAKAAQEMQASFNQCHRCGQWVCEQICWNGERGVCTSCAPRLDREIAGRQAQAQVDQLHQKITQVDWAQGVNYRDQAVGVCPSCQQETGGGKFCQNCGTSLLAAPTPTRKFCGNCGTAVSPGAMFCAECGTSTV
jgi:hypothetical protein